MWGQPPSAVHAAPLRAALILDRRAFDFACVWGQPPSAVHAARPFRAALILVRAAFDFACVWGQPPSAVHAARPFRAALILDRNGSAALLRPRQGRSKRTSHPFTSSGNSGRS